jgi:ABC-type polysaccharide/polyol phosphate export permease
VVIADYIRSIQRHREIVWSLVWRDFSTRYKQAVLGVGWAVLYPIFMTLILWLAFGMIQPTADPSGIPPLLRFYSGLHPYNLFTSGVIYGTISVVANAGLVTKVRVPSETFPLSAVLSALFDFAFGSIAFLGLMMWYHQAVRITWNVLWLIPLLGFELVFTLAVVQVMAAACVIARDLRYGAPILCQIGLFLVPVIYSVPETPRWLHLAYMANPLAVFVDGFRRATVEGLPPRGPSFGLACCLTVLAFWLSCRLFRNAQVKFADLV